MGYRGSKGVAARSLASAFVLLIAHCGLCGAVEEGALPEIKMVSVKGGCFQMGDIFDGGDKDEHPVREVCVEDFSVGAFEVTQELWTAVMGGNPAHFKKGGPFPVEMVSWLDVREFIEKLNARTDGRYRLPTEAEWEFAARSGGREQKFAGTSDPGVLVEYAWFRDNSGYATHEVGLKKPNALGIHDMSGNVSEWVADWYAPRYAGQAGQRDPRGPAQGEGRVIRGGSWGGIEAGMRTTDRNSSPPDFADFDVGFRLAGPRR